MRLLRRRRRHGRDGGNGSAPRPPFENLPPAGEFAHDGSLMSFEGVPLERPLGDYVREDPYPMPCARDREGYSAGQDFGYWLSGLKDYLFVKRLLDHHGFSLGPGAKVLDFGCASGRVLRHLSAHEKGLDLWGCDLNPRHVDWIRKFLGPGLHVFQNASSPPSLPLDDDQFSLICAFSVFTHIDETELGWLAELRRVLRPGGYGYCTIESDRTWSTVRPASPLYTLLTSMELRAGDLRPTPELFLARMPSRRVAFAWGDGGANALVFHSVEYVRDVWGRFMEVVDIVPEGHGYQDVVLLRKR